MKKLTIVLAAAAMLAVGYSAQAGLILSGSATGVSGNSPNSGNKLTIDYTVDLTAGLYTYTYTLSTSPSEGLTSFTIGSSLNPVYTSTLAIQAGSQIASAIVPNTSVAFYFNGVITGGTVSYTSSYGPGNFAWGVNDLSVTWNNPPLIPAPVPEASTAMAGLLMILPLGVGAIRAIRKERVA